MFERRLRLFLLFIFLGAFLLAARAAQVQVLQRDHWADRARHDVERPTFIRARRGNLLDYKRVVIATDVPSFEASVNFRVMSREPEATWLKDEGRRRARRREGWTAADEDERLLMISEEQQGLRNDLHEMWTTLAQISGSPIGEIDAARAGIVEEVAAKHRQYIARQFGAATRRFHEAPSAPWYARLVSGTPREPEMATFEKETIADQQGFHAILTDLTQQQYNALALAQDRFPQYRPDGRTAVSVLRLGPTVRRQYPFNDVACQVIGRVANVSAEDRERDVNKGDELRGYSLNDRIGRGGLEYLAEQQLRGTRGMKFADRSGVELRADGADAGQDVQTTIDIKLQRDIQEAFKTVNFQGPDPSDPSGKKRIIDVLSMNGAAVVIDVKTGQVRSLVSVPTFDLNKFKELYPTMEEDHLNRPMENRALVDAIAPGSTIKPIVGLAAVTQKLIGAQDTIECTGYPIINGHQHKKPRCWTMSMFEVGHHRVPSAHPHPNGLLTLSDAIQRSCNVYFITKGDELGLDGLSYWMRQFGLGRRTGIGLPESRGVVPETARIEPTEQQSAKWFASIGQGPVQATPIQIANQMATIARNGVWQRPTLLVNPPPSTQPADPEKPERYDLKLDGAALRAVHEGMLKVVNDPAGTGTQIRRDDVLLAAKTGSATANPLIEYLRGEDGKPLLDEEGRPRYDLVPYGGHNRPNPKLPWYRMSGLDDSGKPKGTHSWVAGYAPANNPQVAFAVYVEYGSSGGIGAGSVVNKLVDACIRHGYITANLNVPVNVTPPAHLARPIDETDGTDE